MTNKPTICGVDVVTWGTTYNHEIEELNFIKKSLFGRSGIGHASLSLTIPYDSKGTELINKFCMRGDEEVIPYQRKTVRRSDGSEEDVYVIYFSIWPSGGAGFL